jgi:hypothetical protein
MAVRTFKMVALCASILLATQGCGSSESDEDTVATVNSPPVLSVALSDNSVDEGAVIVIPFNVIDAEDSFSEISMSLDVSNTKGDVTIDKSAKVIRYQAPWLTDPSIKVISDGFSVIAKDSKGSRVEVPVPIVVNDINDPVKVVAIPPSQAFGFAETQTDSYYEMYIYEGEKNVTFKYNITENDADSISTPDISVKSPLYLNNITPEAAEGGSGFSLKMDIPEINTPSANTEISFSVSDGDTNVQVQALITIINKVKLEWVSVANQVSESKGAVFVFKTSESESYNVSYSVDVTYPDGSPIDFDFPYTLKDKTVTFSPSEGFQGNKNLVVHVTAQNTIDGVPQADFIEKTVLSQTIVAVDDRDDGFFLGMDEFDANKSLFNSYAERKDDVRVASAISKLWMLNGKMTNKERSGFLINANSVMAQEIAVLDDSLSSIEEMLANGDSGQDVVSAMSHFNTDIRKLGKQVRDLLVITELAVKSNGTTVSFKAPSDPSAATTVNDFLTHYVGNSKYGYYNGSKEWLFNPAYKYMQAVNIFDEYCLI